MAAAVADGKLLPPDRMRAEEHVAECAECRREVKLQAATLRIVRQALPCRRAPARLRARVSAILAGRSCRKRVAAGRPVRRLLLAGVLAASVLLGLGSLLRAPAPGLLELMAQDVRAAEAQELPLDFRSVDLAAVREFYLRDPRVAVPNPVIDLSAAGYRPVGAAVRRVRGTYTTMTVYSGRRGALVCRRFRAGALSLPAGAKRVGDALVYRLGDVTVRVRREGSTVCCIAGRMPPAELFGVLRSSRAG